MSCALQRISRTCEWKTFVSTRATRNRQERELRHVTFAAVCARWGAFSSAIKPPSSALFMFTHDPPPPLYPPPRVYPGTRCGENFGLTAFAPAKTDALLCVGRPKTNAKEQDGDSGGPVFTTINGVRVQIGVNTGSYAADEMRSYGGVGADGYIGFYTNVAHSTIKPWLTKILAGDLAGAKAMTCSELGGPTNPNPNPPPLSSTRRRRRRSRRRRLISGPGAFKASSGLQFPSMVSQGIRVQDGNGGFAWGPGCTGTLIKDNVMLLAAHCFEYNDMSSAFNQMRAWPGAYDLRTAASDPTTTVGEMRFASEIIRHPCYTVPANCIANGIACRSKTKPMEDIAVAILASAVPSSVPIQPILGQGAFATSTLTWPLTDGVIAGWGRYCDAKLWQNTDPSKCNYDDYVVPPPTPNPAGGSAATVGLLLTLILTILLDAV